MVDVMLQWDNGIGDEGAKALGEGLKVNCSVQILNLVRFFLVICFCAKSGFVVLVFQRDRSSRQRCRGTIV